MTTHDTTVAVVGGGPVGACLAIALARGGVAVTTVDASSPAAASRDRERPIALSHGSCVILNALGLWSALASHAAPIRTIHVAEQGRLGTTVLRAADHDIDAFGHVVDASRLERSLGEALAATAGVRVLRPATVVDLESGEGDVRLALSGAGVAADDAIRARLVVAADGTRSTVRGLAGIAVREHDYGQVALTAAVVPCEPAPGSAFERFTADGPLALLPLTGGRHGLVWTLPPQRAQALVAAPESAFLAALGAAFGGRLGGFRAVQWRALHPLAMVSATADVRGRVVLAGNAARTLHPVAGQGLNLGLRDCAWVAESVLDAHRRGIDPGAPARLTALAAARRPDRAEIVGGTDALVRLFTARLPGLGIARGLGLALLDLAPPLKRLLGRHAMGYGHPSPRMLRGLAP
ncbi:MAG: FAD-dependent monooxygenase [Ectothiorhodospiraceae bacterium]|nr:FAD-dependent monooxygenase [Chromatiales bacterium]MCP5156770.1 FAD-dependent monooxygenase [Ectothiorhodospiraceae bacterium]